MKCLVLGSHGMIGSRLVEVLRARGEQVTPFDWRADPTQDLRQPGVLDRWLPEQDFVFFLAFDVGGAKFLARAERDPAFFDHNLRLMTETFASLRRHGTPFIFVSSFLAAVPGSAYGQLKAVGEAFSRTLGGTVVRCWNVYGLEPVSERSHVITDFVASAFRTGTIPMLTDGSELRQFLHVDDCTEFLARLAVEPGLAADARPLDLTSFAWTSILDLARQIADRIPGTCVQAGHRSARISGVRLEPDRGILDFWRPAVPLGLGLDRLITDWRLEQ